MDRDQESRRSGNKITINRRKDPETANRRTGNKRTENMRNRRTRNRMTGSRI